MLPGLQRLEREQIGAVVMLEDPDDFEESWPVLGSWLRDQDLRQRPVADSPRGRAVVADAVPFLRADRLTPLQTGRNT